jgi:alpha-tubulin suppressor-like RCC1 family protein
MRQLIKSKIHDFREANWYQKSNGFLLPAVIAIGLGISVISGVALNAVSQNSTTLSVQNYNIAAHEAAQSGIAAARSCVETQKNTGWSNDGTYDQNENTVSKLRPGTDCNGGNSTATVTNTDVFTSSYEVSNLQYINTAKTAAIITSKGTVKVKGPNGVISSTISDVIRTYAQTGSLTGSIITDQISTGASSACTVTGGTSSWVYCWGSDNYGQLGDNTNYTSGQSSNPVAVTGNSEVKQVTNPSNLCGASGQAACAPATLGSDMKGKLVKKVSVGADHACAVATEANGSSGRAYCWGHNNYGQLGNGTTNDSSVPIATFATAAYTEIIPGYCLGFSNPFTGCSGTGLWIPEQRIDHLGSALAGRDITDITAGDGFTCALSADGKVGCWGRNDTDQLGNRGTDDSYPYPQAVSQDSQKTVHVEQICNGFTFDILFLGSICIGNIIPEHDEVSPTSGLSDMKVISLSTVKDASMCVLAVNSDTTVGSDKSGYPVCWGRGMGDKGTSLGSAGGNEAGCTVDGYVNFNAAFPVRVSETQKFKTVYTDSFATGLADDGKIYWWGGNGYDQRTCTKTVCTSSIGGSNDKIALDEHGNISNMFNLSSSMANSSHAKINLVSKKTVNGSGKRTNAAPSKRTGSDGNGNTTNHKNRNKPSPQPPAPTGPVCTTTTPKYYNVVGTGYALMPIGPLFNSSDTSVLSQKSFAYLSGTARGLICVQTVSGAALYCDGGNRETYPDCAADGQLTGKPIGTCIDPANLKVCTTRDIVTYTTNGTSGSTATTKRETNCIDPTLTTDDTRASTAAAATSSDPVDIADSTMARGQTGSGYVPSNCVTTGTTTTTKVCDPDPTGPQAVYADGWLKGKQITAISTDPSGYTCVIASGAIGCWGANGNGRLGVGDTADRNIPTAISGITVQGLSGSGSASYNSTGAFNYPIPF